MTMAATTTGTASTDVPIAVRLPAQFVTLPPGVTDELRAVGPPTHSASPLRSWQELTDDHVELFRLLVQDHLDLRALRESRLTGIRDADGADRSSAESGHSRALHTIFGEVVRRVAYRGHGLGNLYPADAALNLPTEKHSPGRGDWPRSRPPAAPSTTRARRSSGPPGNSWVNARSKTSQLGPRSTSTPSTPRGEHPKVKPATCSCCPVTAKAS